MYKNALLKAAFLKAASRNEENELSKVILSIERENEIDLREQKLLNKFRQLQQADLVFSKEELDIT